jgi:Tfp pilus assembly protein PilF
MASAEGVDERHKRSNQRINAGKLDSAEILAKRALLLDRKAPYAYSILASIAKNKKDYATASETGRRLSRQRAPTLIQ